MTPHTEDPLSLRDRADLFQALSDETRLTILDRLQGGERCVCELQADLDAAQPRLSFHLRVLRDAGLVTSRREGRWSYYALVRERLELVQEAIPGAGGEFFFAPTYQPNLMKGCAP